MKSFRIKTVQLASKWVCYKSCAKSARVVRSRYSPFVNNILIDLFFFVRR